MTNNNITTTANGRCKITDARTRIQRSLNAIADKQEDTSIYARVAIDAADEFHNMTWKYANAHGRTGEDVLQRMIARCDAYALATGAAIMYRNADKARLAALAIRNSIPADADADTINAAADKVDALNMGLEDSVRNAAHYCSLAEDQRDIPRISAFHEIARRIIADNWNDKFARITYESLIGETWDPDGSMYQAVREADLYNYDPQEDPTDQYIAQAMGQDYPGNDPEPEETEA